LTSAKSLLIDSAIFVKTFQEHFLASMLSPKQQPQICGILGSTERALCTGQKAGKPH
jgi:hypothetical protein